MNEQTAALITNLAAKLGTTSEYLWAVLVKQAPISSAITVFQWVLTVLILYLAYRFRVAIGKGLRTFVDECDVLAFIVIGVGGVAAMVWLLACMFSIEGVLTGFLNPDYWALNKILSSIKSK